MTSNKAKDKFTVTIEDVDSEIKTKSGESIGSAYKVGDKIEFYRVDD